MRTLDFRLIRSYPFRWVFLAQGAVELADQMFLVALAWAILSSGGGGGELGLVLGAWALPRGVFLLLGGVVVDRSDSRALGVAMSACLALLLLGLAAADALRWTPLAAWVGLALVLGLLDGVRLPLAYSLTPRVVDDARLVPANQWSQLREWLSVTAGPPLGGVLVAAAGPAGSFVAIAALYALSAVLVSRLPALPSAREEPQSALRELADGVRFVRGHRKLRLILPTFAAANLFVLGLVSVGVPVFVKTTLHGDARTLGLVTGCYGVGLAAGTVALGHLPNWFRSTTAGLFALFVLSDASLAAVGASPLLPLTATAMALSGFFLGPASALYQSMLQSFTPEAYLGRVQGLAKGVSLGLEPVSAAGVGLLTRLLPVRGVLLAAGLLASGFDLLALALAARIDAGTAADAAIVET